MEVFFNKPELKTITISQSIIDISESFKKKYDNPSYIMKGHNKYDNVFGVRLPDYIDTSKPFVLVEEPYCLILEGLDMFRAEDGTVFRILRDEIFK